jgi:hypothetical protein
VHGWLCAAAFHTLTVLYFVSLVDYRFPTGLGLALLAGSTALLAWWCIRAAAVGELQVDPKAQVRHRRMILGVSYAIVCAILALASGVAGNDRSWHRFAAADPQIVAAQAVTVDDVAEHRSSWTGRIDGFAEADGARVDFTDQRVTFDDDPRDFSASKLELWAVFAPGDEAAGFVVFSERAEAESLLEAPVVSLFILGLIVMAVSGTIQHFATRERRFFERRVRPVGALPSQVWVMLAVAGLMIAGPLLWLHGLTSNNGPLTSAHFQALRGGLAIWAGGILSTAAFLLGVAFHATGMDKWSEEQRMGRWRAERARRARHAPRATGAEREAKRRKDRRRRQRKRARR